MCGIAGCVGHEYAVGFVTDGLNLMEERGYDSSGIAYLEPETSKLRIIRSVGAVNNLLPKIPEEARSARAAIGHTRWATHGQVAEKNAHPQFNSDQTIAVVHNGTIENYSLLKDELQSLGYEFKSETDTEVIPHLLDYYINEKNADPEEAFNKTVRRLMGAYAILGYFAKEPDTIYAARKGSPLLIGVRGNERFAASMRDIIRLRTRWIDSLNHNEMAKLSSDNKKYKTWYLDGRISTRSPKKDTLETESLSKGEFRHWMLKEIHDIPDTIREATRGRVYPNEGYVKLGGLEDPEISKRLKETERITIIGCGTSYHAGLIGERLIEELANIPAETEIASEFQYKNQPLSSREAVIGISQSGETADTLNALHKAKEHGLLTLGVNNAPGSEMENITDAGVHCRAGKERAVASTKAFVAQVIALAEIAQYLSKEKTAKHQQLMEEFLVLPDKVKQILDNSITIEALAEKYSHFKNFLFIGRGYEHISAMEGALKLKEVSYIHAEAYAAGEMKHGSIAMIDQNFPTFAIATDSPLYAKTLSNISEIKARGGPVIALATEGNESIRAKVNDVIYVPQSLEQTQPILNAVAMQLFAYYMAIKKNLNVDRPRNLAKSVTVE
jgi:glucosamine--fructose-6-phosphate aminotransferase (isomerizing)